MEWFTKPQFTKHNPCSPWWLVGCTAKRIGILISNQFQVLQSPVEMPLCASVQAMASWCCCSDALNEKPQKPNCKHQHSKSTTSWRSSILPLPGAKVLRWLLFKTHFYSAFCFVVVSPPPRHRSHYIAKQPCSQYSLSSQHCMLTCCTRASQGSPFSPHCSILWSPLRPRRINMYWTWSCRFKAKCKAAHSAADQPRAPAPQGGHRAVTPWAVLLPWSWAHTHSAISSIWSGYPSSCPSLPSSTWICSEIALIPNPQTTNFRPDDPTVSLSQVFWQVSGVPYSCSFKNFLSLSASLLLHSKCIHRKMDKTHTQF